MLAFLGASELPGRAGRAWRAGCDVKPGGGSVGPSAPIPGLAHAPVTARTINALFFPAPKPFSKAFGVPGQVSPRGWSTGDLSCSACSWLEHPDTFPPPWVTHPQILHYKILGTSGQGSPVGQAWGNWGARRALHSYKHQGFACSSRPPLIPGRISPGSRDLPSSKEPRLEAGFSQLVSRE